MPKQNETAANIRRPFENCAGNPDGMQRLFQVKLPAILHLTTLAFHPELPQNEGREYLFAKWETRSTP